MKIFLIILLGLAFCIPIIGSLFLCVPKWYRRVVKPRLPELSLEYDPFERSSSNALFRIMSTDVGDILTRHIHPLSFRPLWLVLSWPVTLPLLLIFLYVSAVFAFITMKCPYTSPYIKQRELDKYRGTWSETVGDIRYALSRVVRLDLPDNWVDPR